MGELKEKLLNLTTYSFTMAGIVVNFESIKSFILFVGGLTLLILQIRLHLIKIKNERKNNEHEHDEKTD